MKNIWIATKGLTMGEKLIMSYVLTSPINTNRIGCFYLPLPLLCGEIGIDIKGVQKAVKSLIDAGLIEYDKENSMVAVKDYYKFSTNVAKNRDEIASAIEVLPESPIIEEVLRWEEEAGSITEEGKKDLEDKFKNYLDTPLKKFEIDTWASEVEEKVPYTTKEVGKEKFDEIIPSLKETIDLMKEVAHHLSISDRECAGKNSLFNGEGGRNRYVLPLANEVPDANVPLTSAFGDTTESDELPFHTVEDEPCEGEDTTPDSTEEKEASDSIDTTTESEELPSDDIEKAESSEDTENNIDSEAEKENKADIMKKAKEENEERIEIDFNKLWARLPRKVGKKTSLTAYKRMLKAGELTYDMAEHALSNYLEILAVEHRDPKYIPSAYHFFTNNVVFEYLDDGDRMVEFKSRREALEKENTALGLSKETIEKNKEDFEKFLSAYPKKNGIEKAERCFSAIIESGEYTAEQLISAAKEYSAVVTREGTEAKYQKNAGNFLDLNDRPFRDYIRMAEESVSIGNDDTLKEAFEEYWKVFPKKLGRETAEKNFKALVNSGEYTAEQLITAAKGYASSVAFGGTEYKYQKNAGSFLDNETKPFRDYLTKQEETTFNPFSGETEEASHRKMETEEDFKAFLEDDGLVSSHDEGGSLEEGISDEDKDTEETTIETTDSPSTFEEKEAPKSKYVVINCDDDDEEDEEEDDYDDDTYYVTKNGVSKTFKTFYDDSKEEVDEYERREDFRDDDDFISGNDDIYNEWDKYSHKESICGSYDDIDGDSMY